ncbi:MAG: hypothetical protein V4596_13370 [Bdellovibrionota bacterium]
MKWFLLANIFFVIILFILYKRDNKSQKPSKLNFSKNKRTIEAGEFEAVFREKQENNDQYEKVLNILFQFNGETWDAYEVLGLPAGSNIPEARVAFERALKEGKDSEAFLKAALNAIVHIKKG